MWVRFQKVFCEIPLCALVGKVVFCMHGGISDKIKDMDDLFQLEVRKGAPFSEQSDTSSETTNTEGYKRWNIV